MNAFDVDQSTLFRQINQIKPITQFCHRKLFSDLIT